MLKKWMQAAMLVAGLAALECATADAQAAADRALSKTDLSLGIYGAFSGATTGNGVMESPSNAAGGIFEVRHIENPLVGFEGTYSFNRANQVYSSTVSCGLPCGNISPATISADAHEVTADYLASLKIANLRPFVLAGAVYGAGLDWGLLPHIGVRLQYRGNLYKAPDLTKAFSSTGAFTHTAEPMIGIYLRL